MKTPITYYGGKQMMTSIILPLIPEHRVYGEPFFGGGAVFFAKDPAPVEFINDSHREVVNFYRMVQQEYASLEREIRTTLHSRDLHRKAKVIYQNPDMFSALQRAWAFWTLASQSFNASIGTSWSNSKVKGTASVKNQHKRNGFTEAYALRLERVQVECDDALRIIRRIDGPDTFFYCDPPYYNANMGHYDGYTLEDHAALLNTLAGIQGKFLLSTYPSELLQEKTTQHGWHTLKIKDTLRARPGTKRYKTEVLTANYPISTP